MRIFFASPATAHQGALPESRLWHANLYEPLRDLGHTVTTFDFDYTQFNYNLDPDVPEQCAFIESNRPRLSESLLEQVAREQRRNGIDLFFSYFYSAYVDPAALAEIRRRGIVTVNWFCNGSYQLRLVEEIAPAYDYCLVPERYRLEDYRRLGANPIYCQEAANPNVYRPVDVPRDVDVSFVGQRYADRARHLLRLIHEGVDVRAYGPRWQDPRPRRPTWREAMTTIRSRILGHRLDEWVDVPAANLGPALSDEDYISMFSRSKISLGFTTVAEPIPGLGHVKQVRLRDFEAPMSGAFYLVEECEELFDFFEPGKEVATFSDEDELAAKVTYYLQHPNERERIRGAGLARARAEHTWHARFRSVFDTIGLPA